LVRVTRRVLVYFYPLEMEGFHRLHFTRWFHSLYKVLFIFPSRYFFAIEFQSILSLGWNVPPIQIAISSKPNHFALLMKWILV